MVEQVNGSAPGRTLDYRVVIGHAVSDIIRIHAPEYPDEVIWTFQLGGETWDLVCKRQSAGLRPYQVYKLAEIRRAQEASEHGRTDLG